MAEETRDIPQKLPYSELLRAADQGDLFSPKDMEEIKTQAAKNPAKYTNIAEATLALAILEKRFQIDGIFCFYTGPKTDKGEPKVALKLLRKLENGTIEDVLVYGERNNPPQDYMLNLPLTRSFSSPNPYRHRREWVFPKAS